MRGKGLGAVLLARHVLSAFRRSAVALPAMEHVAGAVGRAIAPHLGAEDFVTAVLAQITPADRAFWNVSAPARAPAAADTAAPRPGCPAA